MIQLIIVTISYLNYDSMIKIEIFDQNFDKIGLPPIDINFEIYILLIAEDSNKTLNSLVNQKRCISLKKLNELYFEFKKLNVFNCEINNNGVYEDCDQNIDPVVRIWGEDNHLKDLYRIVEESGECIRGSFIQTLSQFNSISLTVKYFYPNQTNTSYKKNLNGNYVEQADFFKIYTNSTKNWHLFFSLGIDDNNSHNDGLFRQYDVLRLNENRELSLFKKSFELLEFPYKSKCSYYDRSETRFNSSSHKHCIRQCIRYLCQIKLNCSCFALDQEVRETDYGYNTLNICYNYSEISYLKVNYHKKFCANLCPVDCIKKEYEVTFGEINYFSLEDLRRLTINWDDSKPFIIYKDTPVMSFTRYFCYIGGLFGMWFGTRANQLYDFLIEKRFMFYFYFIKIVQIIFDIIIKLFCWIRRKFMIIINQIFNPF